METYAAMPPVHIHGPAKPIAILKRRKQVKSACTNCRKSKTACSNQRPCRRCVGLGLESSCVDLPRKRREKKSECFEGVHSFVLSDFQSPPLMLAKDKAAEEGFRVELKVHRSPSPEGSIQPKYNVHPTRSNIPTLCEESIFLSQTTEYPHVSRSISSPVNGSISQSVRPVSPVSPSSSPCSPCSSPELHQQTHSDNEFIMMSEIRKLQEEKSALQSRLDYFQNSLTPNFLSPNCGMSRWRISRGLCHLLSYSDKFQSITGKNAHILSNFVCVDLYQNQHKGKTQPILDLVGSGKVQSLCLVQLIDYNFSNEVLALSTMQIEFDENGSPNYVTMMTQEFDYNNETVSSFPLFTPLFVKLRDFGLKSGPISLLERHRTTPPMVSFPSQNSATCGNLVSAESAHPRAIPHISMSAQPSALGFSKPLSHCLSTQPCDFVPPRLDPINYVL